MAAAFDQRPRELVVDALNAIDGISFGLAPFFRLSYATSEHQQCLQGTVVTAPNSNARSGSRILIDQRALASGKPSILHCLIDPRAISVSKDFAPEDGARR